MRRNFQRVAPVVLASCLGLIPMAVAAQQSGSDEASSRMASVESPTADKPATDHSASSSDGTAPATATATAAPAVVPAIPAKGNLIAKELAEMKARIAELEKELQESKAADDSATAEKDATALRAAEAEGSSAYVGGTAYLQTAAPATPAAAAAPTPPEITAETTTKSAPFGWFDQTWLNDGGHNVDSPMSTKYFTPEIRFDANYILDYNHPSDDSMVGSTEMYRSQEFQLEQVSVGGDFRIQNTRGRILTMNGLFSQATVRNDASYNRGQWDLKDAYKYFSEAWGGYHWDVNHGLNVDAGIFVSYVGLFSYYNFDNWAYQPSYVSSNTPWFFNGVRIQWFPTDKLKIEPWIINGWQSYARYNGKPGLGGQVLWRPNKKWHFNFNDYGLGEDDAGFPGRSRVHADYSLQNLVYSNPTSHGITKFAWTLTGDVGCEYGGGPASFATVDGVLQKNGASPMKGTTDTYNGGVNCHNSKNGRPKQMFIGWMSYARMWWNHDRNAITLGGGQMNNTGRYLTLLPSINGATATTGTPYFTENAGDRAQAHDMTFTYDYMPSQFIVFRLEEAYRFSGVPYWSGRGGVTPPGGNNGNPADYQCAAGGDSGYGYVYTNTNTGVGVSGQSLAIANCQALNLSNGFTGAGDTRALWWPDLRTNQTTTLGSIMVRF